MRFRHSPVVQVQRVEDHETDAEHPTVDQQCPVLSMHILAKNARAMGISLLRVWRVREGKKAGGAEPPFAQSQHRPRHLLQKGLADLIHRCRQVATFRALLRHRLVEFCVPIPNWVLLIALFVYKRSLGTRCRYQRAIHPPRHRANITKIDLRSFCVPREYLY